MGDFFNGNSRVGQPVVGLREATLSDVIHDGLVQVTSEKSSQVSDGVLGGVCD